jgi:prevent-host-death family protein
MKVTAKDLRTQTRRLLDAVDRGEQVLITYRGKPRARLVPADARVGAPLRDTGLFGLWKDDERSADVQQFMEELRRPRF